MLSYLALLGKCRYCAKKINPSYFIVELTVGILFLLAALRFFEPGLAAIPAMALANLLLSWYLIAILAVVFVFDLKYMLILRSVTLPAAAIALAANLALGVEFWRLGLGILVCAGFFWLQRVLSHGKWIGGGDVHLGVLMGAALGYPYVLVAMFLAYIFGAVIGILLLSLRRKGWKSELPFGTFLAAATVMVLLYGSEITKWYFGLL